MFAGDLWKYTLLCSRKISRYTVVSGVASKNLYSNIYLYILWQSFIQAVLIKLQAKQSGIKGSLSDCHSNDDYLTIILVLWTGYG